MTMPENNPQMNEQQDDSPIIPPLVYLLVGIAGLLVTVVVALTASDFNIIGWSGLGVTIIAFLTWAFLFPEEVIALIRGRNLTYSLVGVIATLILLAASALVYDVVQEQNISRDFSERDVFSLDTQVRDVLNAMGDDPTIPTVQILGFYNTTSGIARDRISVLLQDMVNNSGGKIGDFEFVDPAREPLRTQTYLGDNPRIPSIVVAAIDPETGDVSTTMFEIASPDPTGQVAAGQFQIINALLSLSVDGDFRAYFLDVQGSLDIEGFDDDSANGIVGDIEDEWTITSLDPLLLPNPPADVVLNDPLASAEVMIIAGGTQALNDDEIAALESYIQTGGDLIVLADVNTDGGDVTALSDNFSTMLWDNFGVRFRDDLVIDPAIPVRELGRVYQVNNYGTHPIVSGLNPDANRLVMSSPRSIEIAPDAPTQISVLVSTSDQGYAKTGLDLSTDLTEEQLAIAEDDLQGEIPLLVAAENTETGSRLVLVGSTDLMENEWRVYSNIEAPEVSESAIYWASDAQNFSEVVRQLVPEPQELDTPVFVTSFQLTYMRFITVVGLPFGMLLIGLLVWFVRRPNQVA